MGAREKEVGYSFPGPFKPMPNQVERFNFLLENQYAFDLSDMGTGKTATAVWAVDYLIQMAGGSALILAPKTTLNTVWERHCASILGDPGRYVVLSGSNAARAKTIAEGGSKVYISNYECLLATAVRTAIHSSNIHTLIVDECTKFKHYKHNASDSQSLHSGLREIAHERIVWGLTATPMPNSPMNAYGIARAIRQDYREAMTRFRNRTHIHKDLYTWVPMDDAVEKAYQILQPSIRVRRDDCYEIPDATTERRLVKLGDDATKAYGKLKREAFISLGDGKHVSAPHEAGLRNKLLQVSGGAVYTNEGSFKFDPGERAKEVLNILEQTNEKVVILIPYRNQLELVKELVNKAGHSCALIHGDVKGPDRGRLIDLFQRTRHPRVLAADPRVLSHGVELTAASVLVWWLPPDSNEVYQQAIGRLTRRGQTQKVVVIQLCGTPEEGKIYSRLERREALQGVLLESLLE
jgi:SNF2 family DNA or RNA helicase